MSPKNRATLGSPSMLAMTVLLFWAHPTPAQSTRFYGEFLGGVCGPSGNSGAWSTLDDLYDRYDWGWRGNFDEAEDLTGPYFGVRGGVLLWDQLDLSVSAGYYWGETEVIKNRSRYYYDPWYGPGGPRLKDEWTLSMAPLSASLGWSFIPWSIVRPYVGGGVDLYFWDFDGHVESLGDFWRPYPYHEHFSSDGIDLGGHTHLGLDISHPNWWVSVTTEFRYTWVTGELEGDMADFLDDDTLDLSGWSLLLGARFRGPSLEGRDYPIQRPSPAPPVELFSVVPGSS